MKILFSLLFLFFLSGCTHTEVSYVNHPYHNNVVVEHTYHRSPFIIRETRRYNYPSYYYNYHRPLRNRRHR